MGWTEPQTQAPGQLALAVFNDQVVENLLYLRDLPDARLTNNTGGSVAAGYVAVQDTSAAATVIGTTVVGSPNRVVVAVETIASAQVGRWRVTGQVTVNVHGTVAIGDPLQTSATVGRAQAGTDNRFAVALSANASGDGQVVALLVGQQATVLGTTLTPTVKTTASNVTYTATEIKGGLIARDPNGASRTDTLPTAANLVAAIPGAVVGTAIPLVIRNDADATEPLTINAGTGGTLDPATAVTLARQDVIAFLIRLTNVGGGTEAYTVYPLTRYVAAGGSGGSSSLLPVGVVSSGSHGPETLTITSSSVQTLVAAPAGGNAVYVSQLAVSNSSTSGVGITILDDTTVQFAMYLAASGGGFVMNFNPPWELTAAKALKAQLGAAVTDVRVNYNYVVQAAS